MSASETIVRRSRTRASLVASLLVAYAIGASTGVLLPQLVRSSSSVVAVTRAMSGTAAATAYESFRQGERAALDLAPAATAYESFRQGERAP